MSLGGRSTGTSACIFLLSRARPSGGKGSEPQLGVYGIPDTRVAVVRVPKHKEVGLDAGSLARVAGCGNGRVVGRLGRCGAVRGGPALAVVPGLAVSAGLGADVQGGVLDATDAGFAVLMMGQGSRRVGLLYARGSFMLRRRCGPGLIMSLSWGKQVKAAAGILL